MVTVAYVLIGLYASRFTCPASQLAGAQISLVDIVDFWANKLEWGQNASMKTSGSASRFACQYC